LSFSLFCSQIITSICLSFAGKQGQPSQILYTKRAALSSQASPSVSSTSLASSSLPQESPESGLPPSKQPPIPSSPSQSQATVRAREFAADLFRRAQGGGGGGEKENEGQAERTPVDGADKEASGEKGIHVERREEEDCRERRDEERRTSLPQASTSGGSHNVPQCSEQGMSPTSSSSSPSSPSSSSQEGGPSEPGYVNYSRLCYRLQQPGTTEQNAGGEGGKGRRGGHTERRYEQPSSLQQLNGVLLYFCVSRL